MFDFKPVFTSTEFLGHRNLKGKRFSKEPPDLIIIGACATGNGWPRHDPKSGVVDPNTPDMEYFRQLIIEHSPNTILLVSGCCGRYRNTFRDSLCREFPEVSWEVPSVGDMHDSLSMWVYVEELERIGVLVQTE